MYSVIEATTTSLQDLLSNLGTIVTNALGWVGDVAETIIETPALYLTMGFLVLGAAVALFGRMLSKN